MFSFVLIHSFASTLFCFTSCFLHALRFSLLNFFSCISFCFAWFFSLLPLLFYDCLSRPFPFVCLPSFPAPFLLFAFLLSPRLSFCFTRFFSCTPFYCTCFDFAGAVTFQLCFFPLPITTTGLNGLKHCCRSVGNHLDTAQPFRCAFRSAGHVLSLPFPFIDLFTTYWFAFTAPLDHGSSFILPALEFYNFGNGEMVFKINFMLACGRHKIRVDS